MILFTENERDWGAGIAYFSSLPVYELMYQLIEREKEKEKEKESGGKRERERVIQRERDQLQQYILLNIKMLGLNLR